MKTEDKAAAKASAAEDGAGKETRRDVWAGLWRLADPKISLTSFAGIYLAAALAATEHEIDWIWLILLGLAFMLVETAKNAWGDVIDWESGTDLYVAEEDRTDFSGGKRVLVDGLLTARQCWWIAAVATAAALVLGALIVLLREFDALWIGLAGLVLGWSYHGPPLKLVYRGAGELLVVLIYGPAVVVSTYLVLTHEWSLQAAYVSLPLGLVIAAFLWINEFPDYYADRRAGKMNLVARLGKGRAARVYPVWYLAALGLTASLPALGLPPESLAGAIFALPAFPAVWWVARDPESFHRHRPAQPMALLAFLLYSLGAGTGLLVA